VAFTKSTVATNNVSLLADEPSITAAQLKATFDKYGVDDKTWVNAFIDELEATTAGASGAHSIGSATIAGITGNTVHAQLGSLIASVQDVVVGDIPNGTLEETKMADIYRDVTITYTGGGLPDVVTFKLGGVTKKTVTYTYTGVYVNTTTTVIVDGDTITTTFVYDGNNQITGITKVVS
jgi:hypothetical protein